MRIFIHLLNVIKALLVNVYGVVVLENDKIRSLKLDSSQSFSNFNSKRIINYLSYRNRSTFRVLDEGRSF